MKALGFFLLIGFALCIRVATINSNHSNRHHKNVNLSVVKEFQVDSKNLASHTDASIHNDSNKNYYHYHKDSGYYMIESIEKAYKRGKILSTIINFKGSKIVYKVYIEKLTPMVIKSDSSIPWKLVKELKITPDPLNKRLAIKDCKFFIVWRKNGRYHHKQVICLGSVN